MQSADDVKEEGEAANAVDGGGQTEQTYARLRDTLLVVAAACAVVSLGVSVGVSRVLHYSFPSGFYVPPWLVGVWFAPPMSALVSFVGAFLCALGCWRSRRLLRHAGVVLGDVAIMTLMYVYCPWVYFETDPPQIVYAPIWSPPLRSEIMIDGQSLLAVGRLVDQYMLVILFSSILVLLVTRKSAVKVG